MADEKIDVQSGRKRPFVTLVQLQDELADRERDVIVGNCLSETAISRSGVLSGVGNTDGRASLPSQLSPADIRLWEAACVVEFDIRVEELVTVLKVADTLGDEKCSLWVDKLAHRVAATDWKQPEPAGAMLCALLRLPPHLLHDTLHKSCIWRPRSWSCSTDLKPLHAILETLPPPLHAAAIAMSCRGGALRFHRHAAATVLTLLAGFPLPDTTLKSIEIVRDPEDGDPPDSPQQHATGALLARAAANHPSLTRLAFRKTPVRPQWLRSFTDCLNPGALPNLVALSLCADAHPGGCAEAISCLAHLPALTNLDIVFALELGEASPEVSLTAYTRVAATPATVSLPALKKLAFYEGHMGPGRATCSSCADLFLPSLSVPALTDLTFSSSTGCPSSGALMARAARYHGLHELYVHAVLHAADITATARVTPDAQRPFPPLTELTVCSDCPASTLAMAARFIPNTSTSLTSLIVSLVEGRRLFSDSASTAETLSAAWSAFSRAMPTLSKLQYLELECICGVPADADARAAFSRDLASGLASLSALTHLQLQAGYQELVPESSAFLIGSSIGGAVAALSALKSLVLWSQDAKLEFDSFGAFFDGVAKLQGLEKLELMLEGWTVAQVVDLLKQMPDLQECAIFAHSIAPEMDVDEFVELVGRSSDVYLDLP